MEGLTSAYFDDFRCKDSTVQIHTPILGCCNTGSGQNEIYVMKSFRVQKARRESTLIRLDDFVPSWSRSSIGQHGESLSSSCSSLAAPRITEI